MATTKSKSTYVTGVLPTGQKQTFTSAEVARQYGATVDAKTDASRVSRAMRLENQVKSSSPGSTPAAPVSPLPTSLPLNTPTTMPPSPSTYRYVQPAAPAKPTVQPVDENAIREETRKRMQSSIDAIEANYANLITQENAIGQDRTGQTRAVNARSGLLGSDFGTAQAEKTTQFNRQQVKSLEDEKTAKVQSILERIEDRASAEIARRREEAEGQYERDFEMYKLEQDEARANFKTLAQAGFNLEALDPQRKAELFRQAGYDDPALGELVYNALKPKAAQIDWKTEKLEGGKLLFWGVDPVTGELKRQELDYDLPPDYQFTIAPDGTPIVFNKATGEATIADGNFSKPEDTLAGLTKDQVAQLNRVQDNVRVDPDIKEFIAVRDGYERVKAGQALDSAQGDIAIIFGYMKLNDPTSVVRENEQATAENAGGIPERVRNLFNRARTGERLTPEQRLDFTQAALALYQAKKGNYDKALEFYGAQLDQFEIPRDMALRDFASTEASNERRTLDGVEYEKVDGGWKKVGFNQVGNTSASTKGDWIKKTGTITAYGSPLWKPGLDVAAKKGTPLTSPVSGTVIATAPNGGFGKQVKVRLKDGSEMWFSHLDSYAVSPGQQVRAGQTLGAVGNTGNVIRMGGDGSHVDITWKRPGGGYYTAKEVEQVIKTSAFA